MRPNTRCFGDHTQEIRLLDCDRGCEYANIGVMLSSCVSQVETRVNVLIKENRLNLVKLSITLLNLSEN